MKLQFYKYQGTGNDFVMIDDRDQLFDRENHQLVADLCHRRFGIGADGLILLRNHDELDFEMIYYNADGFEGSLCGNGGRCTVKFAHDLGLIQEHTRFMAVDGEHEARVEEGKVHLKMADLSEVEVNEDHFFLDTGSPHYVSFVDDVHNFPVVNDGRAIRNNDRFKKEGTNVNFVELVNAKEIVVRTYERGVEDETLSCGTGVTAAVLSSSYKELSSPVKVRTLGGELAVSFDKTKTGFENIFLIGPAERVFEGAIEL